MGVCQNIEVAMSVALDSGTHLGEDGTFYTAAMFGCIYWSNQTNDVVDFDDLLNDD